MSALQHPIYTIGYANWQPEALRAAVTERGATLWDIRYSPNSRRPEWRRESLRLILGPRYLHMACLGNRNYAGDGPIELAAPHRAVEPARVTLEKRPIVLLCACKDAETCHRSVAADYLAERLHTTIEHLTPSTVLPVPAAAPATGADGYYPIPAGKEPMKCRSCGASVVWAKTASGKSIPLDLAHVRVGTSGREALTHFATCKHAREWRLTGRQPLICTLGEDLVESERLAAQLQQIRESHNG